MNEQEIKTIQKTIEQLREVEQGLIRQRKELEYLINDVRDEKQRLLRLLPTQNRIDALFQ